MSQEAKLTLLTPDGKLALLNAIGTPSIPINLKYIKFYDKAPEFVAGSENIDLTEMGTPTATSEGDLQVTSDGVLLQILGNISGSSAFQVQTILITFIENYVEKVFAYYTQSSLESLTAPCVFNISLKIDNSDVTSAIFENTEIVCPMASNTVAGKVGFNIAAEASNTSDILQSTPIVLRPSQVESGSWEGFVIVESGNTLSVDNVWTQNHLTLSGSTLTRDYNTSRMILLSVSYSPINPVGFEKSYKTLLFSSDPNTILVPTVSETTSFLLSISEKLV